MADSAQGSCRERGAWLIAHRWEMDRGEASWLAALARFDRDAGWADDGQLSAVSWLMWKTDMARATAFEKVRIARQLLVRPVLAEALAGGRVSYSAVRAITRVEGATPEVDAALVDLAEAGSVADVERAVRVWQRYADQERPPADPDLVRGVRIVHHGDGTATLTAVLTELEAEEVATALQAFVDLSATPVAEPSEGAGESSRGDELGSIAAADLPTVAAVEEAVGQSSAGDWWGPERTVSGWGPRRADALMDLARTALAHAGDGHAMGADRYLVHVVERDGRMELLDGTPLDAAMAGQVDCDSGRVDHGGVPLSLGRKTKRWSTAQRRAVRVRDRGCSRFPGCEHRIADIHHGLPWEDGGPTDVANGLLICTGHHRLLHHGYRAEGDANGPVSFHRPDGTTLGTSAPPAVLLVG